MNYHKLSKLWLPVYPQKDLLCCIMNGKPDPLINQTKAVLGMKFILNFKAFIGIYLSNNQWFYFPQVLIPCSTTIVGLMINNKKGI